MSLLFQLIELLGKQILASEIPFLKSIGLATVTLGENGLRILANSEMTTDQKHAEYLALWHAVQAEWVAIESEASQIPGDWLPLLATLAGNEFKNLVGIP